MSDPFPRRLLDPEAPTPPRLRALLDQLRPPALTEEAEERMERRIHETLADEAVREADPARRSAG